jgi:predicted anti-sigma-YlaC factor YlaD
MKCSEIQELMPDLAAGMTPATPEVEKHLKSCGDCAAKLNEFRQTMALLDEWQAPEPSPYFDTRLQARLREEAAKQPVGWWQWIRRPAMAAAFAVVVVAGATMLRDKPAPPVALGTAVSDLQTLDKNEDVYANFDELDDLQVQQDVTANP